MANVRGKYTLGGLKFIEGTTTLFEIAQSSNGGVKGEFAVYADSGAIPIRSHTALLSKGSAQAMTLTAPTATTHDGVTITVVSITAQTHTVTATTIGFNAGNTSTDVGTYGGAIGDGFTFVAYQGEWYVNSNINVTLA